MASWEHFDYKMRKCFQFYDLDKDGSVTRAEVVASADRISSLSHAGDEDVATTRQQLTKWVEALFPEGAINEDDFVQRSIKAYEENPDVYTNEVTQTTIQVFKMVDINKDGFISPEELLMFYKIFGRNNNSLVTKVFEEIDANHDGLISLDELVGAFKDYFCPKSGRECLFEVN